RSRAEAPPYARCLGDALAHWAHHAPDRTLYAERDAGAWHRVSYRDAFAAVRALGAALLAMGLAPERPLMILSGNSIDHALLALAAMHVGVPVAPISPAYSLMSSDHAKLRVLAGIVQPGAVYVADRTQFARALAALELELPVLDPARVAELRATAYSPAVDAAFAAVDGDTIAKLLFTSGSTGTPKAVINTQRMLCANQAGLAAGWSFLADRPPVIVDWLPWSHTFGANHNANLVLAHGGTLYIDHGKPIPGAFDETLRNLREVPSTIYFNVPRGFDLLVGHLETDAALRDTFFRDLDVVFYAAAALSPATWKRLEAVAAAAGKQIAMTSAWGSTETSPLVTQVCYPIDRAGVIGVPIPGTELAFVPVGDKLEMRVKGANVAPGYLRADRTIEPLPLDELGFYPMGDAGRLADDADPDAGVVFEGRVAENFKLASGTWVHVGEVRLALIAACSPHLADAVISGHDRDELGALVFLAPGADREALQNAVARHATASTASSTRIGRVVILVEPANIDAGEITDKGYLNQRRILERRAGEVERLYTKPDFTL
ncbi:MAG TPA: feruloyl-CoA synthase, partial [Kofleriaceae bacterium]|nr:feruloyl-CoA synthase [Kofleriaceae bacterium]